MGFFDALTTNRAELRHDAADEALRPIVVSLAPVHAVSWAREVIAALPRWQVAGAYEERGMIHATHSTRLWRFVDDVHLGFEPDPRGARISARSQSRKGKGDFGQNARNLRELTRALHRAERERLGRLSAGATAAKA